MAGSPSLHSVAPAKRPVRLLSKAQVADALQVSLKTVDRLIGRGELPRHYIGNQVRISDQDLHAFVAVRRVLN